jgi:hypothetical protein
MNSTREPRNKPKNNPKPWEFPDPNP